MKKCDSRPLRLSRETIRSLTALQLARVEGGVIIIDSDVKHSCGCGISIQIGCGPSKYNPTCGHCQQR